MTNWTHRVVKRLRGMQGEYFDFPTARTFSGPSAEADARAYAESFAREQRAASVHGAIIEVRTRKGGWPGHRGHTIAAYKADQIPSMQAEDMDAADREIAIAIADDPRGWPVTDRHYRR